MPGQGSLSASWSVIVNPPQCHRKHSTMSLRWCDTIFSFLLQFLHRERMTRGSFLSGQAFACELQVPRQCLPVKFEMEGIYVICR